MEWSPEFRAELRRMIRLAVQVEFAARDIAANPDPGDTDAVKGPHPIFPGGREHIHELSVKQRLLQQIDALRVENSNLVRVANERLVMVQQYATRIAELEARGWFEGLTSERSGQ
jgi:hypothetical protein